MNRTDTAVLALGTEATTVTTPPEGGRALSRVADAAAVGLVVFALGVTYWTLFYGVDFTDAAYYVAVPYRLIRGAHVFTDDNAFAEGFASLLVYPFMRVYYAVAGLTGIVLFARNLQFLFSVGVAVAVGFSLRNRVGTRMAALAASLAVLFVPFNIHELSYNTLGSGFFTAGCFLGFGCTPDAKLAQRRLAAGICLGLAAFAYPPLILASLTSVGIRLATSGSRAHRRSMVYDVCGLAIPLVAMSALVLAVGVDRVVADYHARTGATSRGAASVLRGAASWEHSALVLAVGMVLLLWASRARSRRFRLVLLPVIPLVLGVGHLSATASLGYDARIGCLAVPLFVLLRESGTAKSLMASVWVPSAVAGATTALSSSNGGEALAIGFRPAAIVAMILLSMAVSAAAPSLAPVASVVTAAAVMLPFLFFEAGASYRDRAPWSLHTQISGGAYAGLETTVAKKVFLRQLTRDIGSIAPSCRIAFFNDFPAGYLLTPAEPDTNSTWPMASPSSRGSESGDLGRYYERHGFPDMVVLLKRIPAGSAATSLHKEYPARAFPFAVGRKSYVSVAKRSDYVVYGRTARCD